MHQDRLANQVIASWWGGEPQCCCFDRQHLAQLALEDEVFPPLHCSFVLPLLFVVVFLHRGFNQRGELVAHCRRSALQLKSPAAVGQA